MDSIGGAKILSKRLLKSGASAAAAELPVLVATDALPLFHWTGVEPAPPESVPEEPPQRRWRRPRNR